MSNIKYIFLALTFTIILVICFFIINSHNESYKTSTDFNKVPINLLVKGNISVGKEFSINNKIFYQDQYNFFYLPKNNEEMKMLAPNYFSIHEICWRDVTPPFRIIKKENDNELILIKNKKKFIFIKKLNP